MRLFNLFALAALIVTMTTPALAEGTPALQSMRYTRINQAPETTTYIKTKTIKHEDEQPAQEEETDSQLRIWNKYKALATGAAAEEDQKEKKAAAKKSDGKEEKEDSGQSDDENTEEIADKAENEKEKSVKKEKLEPARPGGIAGIIDDYRRNKAQRSQMRSIRITKPDEEKEKPEG